MGLEKELMFVSKERIFEEKDAFFMKHIDTYDPFKEVLFANYTLHEVYGKYEKLTLPPLSSRCNGGFFVH